MHLAVICILFLSNELNVITGHKDPHGVPMGIRKIGCDTGEYNLEVDWNEKDAEDFTCFQPKRNMFTVNASIKSTQTNHYVQPDYMPQHICMTSPIDYDEWIPTFGDHRPLWPVYGEYRYLPVQRWLHNLEHGAIVMLYHPCANPMQTAKLRYIVTNCLRKHVISPNRHLTEQRPFALVAWGHRLEFNFVNQTELIHFIKITKKQEISQVAYSYKAPESFNVLQGQFDKELIKVSEQVRNSDYLDSDVCPESNFKEN